MENERLCANWIKTYLEYTQHSEAPRSFRFWSAVYAIAGVLRSKVWIDMGLFVWKPNFYIILVAPPGIATKSTAFGTASSMVSKVPGIFLGPDATTWQALAEYMATNQYEEMINGNLEPMSSVAMAISELATFIHLEDQDMMNVLTDLWDNRDSGKPWQYSTRHSGDIIIPQPFIHFIGGTTPSWISENFRENTIGGGFASRTIFVFANKKEKLVALPYKQMNGTDQAKLEMLQQDLIRISRLKGAFRLSPAAEDLAEELYREIWENPSDILKEENLQGYRARKQCHSIKLAMVLSASKSDNLIIERDDLQASWNILNDVEKHTSKIFSTLTLGTELAKHEFLVLESLREYKHEVNQSDFYRTKLANKIGYLEFDKAISALVSCGAIKRRQDGASFKLISA